jgi:hypothetical protein
MQDQLILKTVRFLATFGAYRAVGGGFQPQRFK